MADRELLRSDLGETRRVELTVDECFAIRHAIAYTFGEIGKDMMRDTGAERWSKCAAGMLMDDAYRKLVAALPSQSTDDCERALTALQNGCRDRGLEVKGDGNWEQMVATVLRVVDNNDALRRRLQQLARLAAPPDDRVRGAAQKMVDAMDRGRFASDIDTAWVKVDEACEVLRDALSADEEASEALAKAIALHRAEINGAGSEGSSADRKLWAALDPSTTLSGESYSGDSSHPGPDDLTASDYS